MKHTRPNEQDKRVRRHELILRALDCGFVDGSEMEALCCRIDACGMSTAQDAQPYLDEETQTKFKD